VNDLCEPICDVEQYYIDGSCVSYGTCADGERWDGNACVPDGCQYGYHWQYEHGLTIGSGECVPRCIGEGEHWNGTMCVVCGEGEHWNGTMCVVCGEGYSWDQNANNGLGSCVCREDYEEYAGQCVPKCPAGYTRNTTTGECVSVCSSLSNMHWDSSANSCVCNEGYELYNQLCVLQCQPGEDRNEMTGECVPVHDTCPPYFHWDGSEGGCVADLCNDRYHWDTAQVMCIQNVEENGQHWNYNLKQYVPNNCSGEQFFNYSTGRCEDNQ
jgi:hypothetical protein